MTTEENKAIVRRFFEAFAANDQETLKEVTTEEFVIYGPGIPGRVDRESHLYGIGLFAEAFSEGRFSVESQVAEDDMVATRLVWLATSTGDFHGLAATGEPLSITAVAFDRIEDSKIAERWFSQDDLSLMQHFGVVPPLQ